MAYTPTHTTALHDTRPGILSRAKASIGAFFVAVLEAQSRSGQIEALQKKSDVELARMGLKREDIVRHVFRDHLY